jgi:hypothetical protein
MSHEEQDPNNVQGSMEPPHRRRCRLATRRRLEGRVFTLLLKLVRISGTRFLLRGVDLSHPETCEFRKNLKLIFLMQGLARVVAFMLPCIIYVLLSTVAAESI